MGVECQILLKDNPNGVTILAIFYMRITGLVSAIANVVKYWKGLK